MLESKSDTPRTTKDFLLRDAERYAEYGPDPDDEATNSTLPAAIGYLSIFSLLSPSLLVGLDKLGVIALPPINLLTDISNNAIH